VAIGGNSLTIATIVACCLSAPASERSFGLVLQGEAAMGTWHDDKPGVRRLLTPQDLLQWRMTARCS
jgi:hypothetical protein